ncbi:SDR family NAD(P)-dependent oxidoreductase [Pseudorhodobacter aquimaris]|uniref:SDR family NAD(P)-dependent oxidoreductase n=1 Tax=Pseudorhodobacter aquimaris TaxID=687412 RepID=UPI000B2EE0E3|nr:SDR family oxidoreductase [Pseudorhodobacter aquimaris]
MEMKNLNVAVVGGASGFGREIAVMMNEQGAKAVAVIDANLEGAQATVALIEKAGGTAFAIKADIATKENAHASFDAAVQAMGQVDSMVNCAAIYPRVPLLEITYDQWDIENAINIKGTYHMCVAAINHMRTRVDGENIAGRIVNITSVDAFKAHPQNAHYAATKAAVVSLTRSFASYVAADQILVNSVAPAGMATDRVLEAGTLPEMAAANPLGRGAKPREIAEWVLIAASNRNTYMTGEQIIVSGGYVYA